MNVEFIETEGSLCTIKESDIYIIQSQMFPTF
jgi:hypothetical protein